MESINSVRGDETRRAFEARTGWRSDSSLFAGWRDDETLAAFHARKGRQDSVATTSSTAVTRVDAKDGSNPQETEPNAEEARTAMVKRKTEAWKQGRTGTKRSRSLAAEQDRQREATGAEASANLAARAARDPFEEIDTARANASTAFAKRCGKK